MVEGERYEDYEGDYITLTGEDDDCMNAVRETIRGLPLPERKIFIMYVEEGTYSGVAKILNCSVPTVSAKIKAIQAKIREKTNRECAEY